MKNDIFTKIVLSVIAINLTVLTLTNLELTPKAYAGETPKTIQPLINTNYGLVPLNEDGSIHVKLDSSQIIDINIARINGHQSFYDTYYNGVHDRIPVYTGN